MSVSHNAGAFEKRNSDRNASLPFPGVDPTTGDYQIAQNFAKLNGQLQAALRIVNQCYNKRQMSEEGQCLREDLKEAIQIIEVLTKRNDGADLVIHHQPRRGRHGDAYEARRAKETRGRYVEVAPPPSPRDEPMPEKAATPVGEEKHESVLEGDGKMFDRFTGGGIESTRFLSADEAATRKPPRKSSKRKPKSSKNEKTKLPEEEMRQIPHCPKKSQREARDPTDVEFDAEGRIIGREDAMECEETEREEEQAPMNEDVPTKKDEEEGQKMEEVPMEKNENIEDLSFEDEGEISLLKWLYN